MLGVKHAVNLYIFFVVSHYYTKKIYNSLVISVFNTKTVQFFVIYAIFYKKRFYFCVTKNKTNLQLNT